MSDPYGRTKIPISPKQPKHFSLLRPIRYFFWAWLWIISFQFYWGWKGLGDEIEKTDPYNTQKLGGRKSDDFVLILILIIVISICLFHIVLPMLLGLVIFPGAFGWWSFWPSAVWLFVQINLFFSFHLNDEEAFQHWKDKLLK